MGININGSNGTTGTNEIETNLTVNKGGEIQHKNMAGTQLPEQSKSIKTLSAFLKSNHTAEINLEQTYKNALKMLNNAKADKNPTDEKVTALNKHIGLYNDALKKEVENETKAVEELKKALKPIKDDLSSIKEEIPNLLEVAKQRKDNLQKQIDKSTSFLGHITNFFAKIFNSKNYVDVQQSRKQVDDLKENIKNLKAVQEEFGKQIGKLETTLKDLEKSKNNSNTKTERKKHAHVKAHEEVKKENQPKSTKEKILQIPEKKLPPIPEKQHAHQKPHKEKPADTLKTATQEKSSKSETITVNGKTHDKTALPKTPEKISKPKPQEPAADALNEKQVFPANDNAMVTEMKNLKLKHVKEEEMNLYKKGLPKEENTQRVENQEPAATEQQIVPQETAKVQEPQTTETEAEPQQVVVDEKKIEPQEVATDKQQVENEQVAADEEQPQEIAADTKQVEQASDKTVPPAPIFEEKAPVQPTNDSQPPAQSTLLEAIQSFSNGALKHVEQQKHEVDSHTQMLDDIRKGVQLKETGLRDKQAEEQARLKDSSAAKINYSHLKPTEYQVKKVDLTAEQKANQAEAISKIKDQKAKVAGQGNFLSEIQQGIKLKKTEPQQKTTTQPSAFQQQLQKINNATHGDGNDENDNHFEYNKATEINLENLDSIFAKYELKTTIDSILTLNSELQKLTDKSAKKTKENEIQGEIDLLLGKFYNVYVAAVDAGTDLQAFDDFLSKIASHDKNTGQVIDLITKSNANETCKNNINRAIFFKNKNNIKQNLGKLYIFNKLSNEEELKEELNYETLNSFGDINWANVNVVADVTDEMSIFKKDSSGTKESSDSIFNKIQANISTLVEKLNADTSPSPQANSLNSLTTNLTNLNILAPQTHTLKPGITTSNDRTDLSALNTILQQATEEKGLTWDVYIKNINKAKKLAPAKGIQEMLLDAIPKNFQTTQADIEEEDDSAWEEDD